MTRTHDQLREDALAIWRAGVAAVDSQRLVRGAVRRTGDTLSIEKIEIPLADVRRIIVVGAGKAGAGMAIGLEEALGEELMAAKELVGWINTPADCVRPTRRIKLHAARPAGVNEPMAEGVFGAERILEMVRAAGPRDLCLCLISGGGSALLPAPAAGISLADKQAVTRLLSDAGADIRELNTVRKRLSRIKGGGLAAACRAGRLITLIISDVMGDPLDAIASGPTIADPTGPAEALAVLAKYDESRQQAPAAVYNYLERAAEKFISNKAVDQREELAKNAAIVDNLVIGNNAVAVDAAGIEAERRGYSHVMTSAVKGEGEAERIGRHLADMALRMRAAAGPDCLITGGEPTVLLVDSSRRGLGGRNQQLILAALAQLCAAVRGDNPLRGMTLLAGGTDGEDGPTDAAGAWIDSAAVARMRDLQLDPLDYLSRNDAYHFFEQTGSLLKTGPTDTNVCDIRVAVVDRVETAGREQAI